MTEAEWLESNDPIPMLKLLESKAKDRKLRLFVVACCRRVWNYLIDHRCRIVVEIAERYADGLSSDSDLLAAHRAAFYPPVSSPQHIPPYSFAANAASASAFDRNETPIGDAMFCAASAASAIGMASSMAQCAITEDIGRDAEAKVQAILLRDIIPNPLRHVAIETAWLTWSDGTVVKLAHSIYDERAFDSLPMLADALEDAGCQDAEILDHCRNPGLHVRGCWLVDLLTGRN